VAYGIALNLYFRSTKKWKTGCKVYSTAINLRREALGSESGLRREETGISVEFSAEMPDAIADNATEAAASLTPTEFISDVNEANTVLSTSAVVPTVADLEVEEATVTTITTIQASEDSDTSFESLLIIAGIVVSFLLTCGLLSYCYRH